MILPVHKFFGYVEVNAYGSQVNLAEPEKTILDSLDRPSYAGDTPEIAGMLYRGRTSLDWQKLIDYGVRFNSKALLQRLGYLLDLLKLPVDTASRDRLMTEISGITKCYLGQPRRWKTGGSYDPNWRVVDNISRQVMMSEIEVR